MDLSIQCNPKFLRATVGKIVASQAAATNTRLPLGLVCKPMAGDVGTDNEGRMCLFLNVFYSINYGVFTLAQYQVSRKLQFSILFPVLILFSPFTLSSFFSFPLFVDIEVVDFGATGIVRCKRCRTYINPYVTWADNGRRWR